MMRRATLAAGLMTIVALLNWTFAAGQQNELPTDFRDAADAAYEKAQKEKAEQADAAYQKWLKDNAEYLRNLCTTEAGEDHVVAWELYQIAVSTDLERVMAANKAGKPFVECSTLPQPAPPETSKEETTGYTWSNSVRQLAGFTWSNDSTTEV